MYFVLFHQVWEDEWHYKNIQKNMFDVSLIIYATKLFLNAQLILSENVHLPIQATFSSGLGLASSY